jgi:transcription elongation factor/antiterminator RfaH
VTVAAIAYQKYKAAYETEGKLNSQSDSTVMSVTSKASWYALQVRSRKEGYVASQIQGQGYECLLPTYKSVRKWSDRMKEIEQPLFPGYLFCRFDFQNRRPVTTTPGVLQIVGYGRTAVSVSDEEIQALQLAVASEMPKQPWPYLEVGQRVRVNYGTLSGLEGILVNVKGNHRVILSVTLLQRSVAMEVETSWLSVVKEETRESMTQRILRPIRVPMGI